MAHRLVCEVLEPGQLAVDLTAGKGLDTRLLYEAVGSAGRVLGFDIQAAAITLTQERLAAMGAAVRLLPVGAVVPQAAGVYLTQQCHSQLAQVVQEPVAAVMANLGFLPGSDGQIITRPATTLRALEQSAARLMPGGRLVVVVYVGHPGGADEGRAVDRFFQQLPSAQWQVLRTQVANRSDAPYLLAAQKMAADALFA